VAQKPEKLIGDKAFDSDKLDKELEEKYDVEMSQPGLTQNVRRQKTTVLQKALKSRTLVLHGCKTSAEFKPGGNITLPTSMDLCSLAAL